jgi:hypothetical protein
MPEKETSMNKQKQWTSRGQAWSKRTNPSVLSQTQPDDKPAPPSAAVSADTPATTPPTQEAPVSPVERKLDGIAAGIRVITKKLDAYSQDKHAEALAVRDVRRRELEPVLAIGRQVLQDLTKLDKELGPTVRSVYQKLYNDYRGLPASALRKADAVFDSIKPIENLLGNGAGQIAAALGKADRLTPEDCRDGEWGKTRSAIEYPIRSVASAPQEVQLRFETFRVRLDELERHLQAHKAEKPGIIVPEQIATTASDEEGYPA